MPSVEAQRSNVGTPGAPARSASVPARTAETTLPADSVRPNRAWLSNKPSWCVDHGERLEALATCDLWLALARGDVSPSTRVWREGMPCWEPIALVPEFALALPESSVWTPQPDPIRGAGASVRPSHVPAPAFAATITKPLGSKPGADDRATVPDSTRRAAAAVDRVSTLPGATETATPAPVVLWSDLPSIPGASPAVPDVRRRSWRDLAAVLGGVAIAVGALWIAAVAPRSAPPRSLMAESAAGIAAPHGPEMSALITAPPLPSNGSTSCADKDESPRSTWERGQKRRRCGAAQRER